jgi:hypothetical protein
VAARPTILVKPFLKTEPSATSGPQGGEAVEELQPPVVRERNTI